MKPYAAVMRNSYGKGKSWYVGTVVKSERNTTSKRTGAHTEVISIDPELIQSL